jgi:hypothetical protein
MENRDVGRRIFLTAASAALGGLALPSAETPRELGAARRSYGERSPYETSSRFFLESATSGTGASRTPLQDLHGIITPSALHFERHHAGVPQIDPCRHELLIHGLVERPLVFTRKDSMEGEIRERTSRWRRTARGRPQAVASNGEGARRMASRPHRRADESLGGCKPEERFGVGGSLGSSRKEKRALGGGARLRVVRRKTVRQIPQFAEASRPNSSAPSMPRAFCRSGSTWARIRARSAALPLFRACRA